MAHLVDFSTIAAGRYHLVANISSFQAPPIDRATLSTYIVQDTHASPPTCQTILIIAKETPEYTSTCIHAKVLKRMGLKPDGPNPHVLVPVTNFNFTFLGAEWSGLVYNELFGPDWGFMKDYWGPDNRHYPPEMIKRVIADALRALVVTQQKEIYAGLSPSSIVFTYPHLDATSVDAVRGFYRWDGGDENMSLDMNPTATGPRGSKDDPRAVSIKLDHLDDTQWEASFDDRQLRVPEAMFGEPLTPASDIWSLGEMAVDIAAQAPRYFIRALYPPAAGETALAQLRYLRRICGELPERYLEKMPHTPPADYDEDALFILIRENPKAHEVPDGEKISDAQLHLLVGLLKSMLKFDPKERVGAEKALKHPYFSD